MSYVYVDTSTELSVGILSDDFTWIEFKHVESKKSSGIVHGLIDTILTRNNIEISSLQGFIYAAGPGSYTGMRVAEGMAQIFDWQEIPVYSFYHFEVPRILKINSGVWIADAFKKELFSYRWQGDQDKVELVNLSEIDRFEKEENLFTNSYGKFHFDHLQETSKLVFENAQDFFSTVVNQAMQKELYYYRELDEDFKKPS